MQNDRAAPPGPTPFFRQIYLRFRTAIAEGHLKPGDRIPSIRALASELNVARGTVEVAYQLLINEGYCLPRGSAGTVVAVAAPRPLPEGGAPAAVAMPESLLMHAGAAPLPFQLGLPALEAFPHKLWKRLAANVLRQTGPLENGYPDARGQPALRQALAGYLAVSRGIACQPEQVFVVAGYRAAFDLISRSLLRPGEQCWVEEPGYFAATNFLQEAGAALVSVPVDGEGIDVAAGVRLAPAARFAVVTPTHQSPLCVALSMPRRLALLDWAKRQQSWIIEDDYDSEYRYQGRPLPALKSLDAHDRVLYCGTFSKVLLPSLRLAYIVVPPALVARFAALADNMHGHCPPLWQDTVARFIEEGHFGRHLKKMRALYALRKQLLKGALEAALGERLCIDHQVGGMHLVARIASSADDRQVAALAQTAGLAVRALSEWYRAPTAQRGLLLSSTNVRDPAEAQAVSARLAVVLKRAQVPCLR